MYNYIYVIYIYNYLSTITYKYLLWNYIADILREGKGAKPFAERPLWRCL